MAGTPISIHTSQFNVANGKPCSNMHSAAAATLPPSIYAIAPTFLNSKNSSATAPMRAAARELILLPTYPRYPESEIEKNVGLIQQFFAEQTHSC